MSKSFIEQGGKLFLKHIDDDNVHQIILDFTAKKYDKLNTQASALGKLKRSIVDDFYPDTPASKLPSKVVKIQLSKDEYDKVNKANTEKFEKRASNCIAIYNWKAWTDGILKGLKSDNIGELYTALLLATGRRSTEIIETAKFAKLKNANHATFTGNLKSDGAMKYKIPLLAPLVTVNSALAKFRDEMKKTPHDNKGLNKMVISITGRKDFTSHTLRSIYASIASEKFKQKRQLSNVYIGKILGHANSGTASRYQCVNLFDGEPTTAESDEQTQAINKRMDMKKRGTPQDGEGADEEEKEKPLSAADFISSGRADSKVIANLVAHYNSESRILSINKLRSKGSGYTVIKRVFNANADLITRMK